MKEPITDARMRCIIKNACLIAKLKYHKDPLWSLVSRLTGHGCTTSTELCKELGFQPCAPVGEVAR